MKFLSQKALIEGNYATIGGKFEMAAFITAPPVVLYDEGRKIYFSLVNVINYDYSKHQYYCLLSRFLENYPEPSQNYDRIVKYSFPKHLNLVKDNEVVCPWWYSKDAILPKVFEETIKHYEEPFITTELLGRFELEKNRYDISDDFLGSLINQTASSFKIGYEEHMDNPLLATQEYIDININELSTVLSLSISLMKQAVIGKLSKYQEFNQSSIWGLLE